MDKARLADFRQTPVIGTFGLGGCNVALVARTRSLSFKARVAS